MFFFFFFKQKTAYEMRISDWSSDVCSSDLDALSHGRSDWRGALRGAPLPANTGDKIMAQRMIRRRSLITFSSTVWGNVEAGEFFDFAEGYKQSLTDGGYIAPDKPMPVAIPEAAKDAEEITVDVPAEQVVAALTQPEPDDFPAAPTGTSPRPGTGRPPTKNQTRGAQGQRG